MAKAEIKMPYIKAYSTFFECQVWYRFKSGFTVTDDSLRIYYSTTPSITSQTPYVSVNRTSGAIIRMGRQVNGWNVLYCRVPVEGTSLTQDTPYWLRARLELFYSDGTGHPSKSYKKYRAPKNPTPVYTTNEGPIQKLFQIAKYTNPHTGDDGDTEYDQIWEDFTDCIVVPSYDVNYEDINEDWEDADYVTHRIVPRSKITGDMELLFPDKTRYNKFLQLIKMNREVNGSGYIMLRVQVNNDIDLEELMNTSQDLSTKKCVNYIGNFFLKFENNPWVIPVINQYSKYDPLRIEIQEA